MRIMIAGSSGFLGSALVSSLRDEGHHVTRLVRREPRGDEARWDPYSGKLVTELLHDVDAVVNLAGAPFVHWPWTASYKRSILESRVRTTTTLADSIADLVDKPVLVNASGADFYGDDRGDDRLDETAPTGQGFLAEVVRQWEAATTSASEAGARVVNLRTSAVLDKRGGPIKVMGIPFRLGIGGRVGNGRQWFPSISLPDWLSAVNRLISDDSMHGPYNLSGPQPVTNAEFTRILAAQLHRPAVLVAPAGPLRFVLGGLATVVIGSRRVLPARLLEAGFTFAHPTTISQVEAAYAPPR